MGHLDDQWRPNVPADIDVVPDDLAGFARMLEEDRALFSWDKAAAIGAAFDQEQVPFPSFAGATLEGRTEGLPEGLHFQIDYGLAWAAMQWMLTEVQQGLMFLEQGSKNIHAAYFLEEGLSQEEISGAWDRYDDVSVVLDAFGFPNQPPLVQEDQGGVDLEALEDQAQGEFDQILEDREGLPETDPEAVENWGTGDEEPRDQDTTIHEGQPGELVVPADAQGMDDHPRDEHPAPEMPR